MSSKSHVYCCVYGCNTFYRNSKEISFHNFPKHNLCSVAIENKFGVVETVDCRKAWEIKLKIGKPITKSMRICSLHFNDEDFQTLYGKGKLKRLKRIAVPSKNLPVPSHTSTKNIRKLLKRDVTTDKPIMELEDDIQHKETQRNFDTHGGVPSKRRKIEKNASRAVSTASNQDPLTTEDDLGQNRDIDEENAFGDNIEHSDNSNSSSRIHFVDVKREIIDEIDIKEEPIGLDDSMDSAYTTQGELHIKKEKEEQFDEFGEFVGVSLKQLPDELADHAKSEIENVLMKFKMLAPNMLTK